MVTLMKKRKIDLFSVIVYVMLTFAVLVTVYPFVYLVSASFSEGLAVSKGSVRIFPVNPNIISYKYIVTDIEFWVSYGNTLIYVVGGVTFSLCMTILLAFPLSRKEFFLSGFLNRFLIITTWFQAGMIPAYLNYKSLGMTDSRVGIIFGFGMTAFYIILMRNYFQNNIPQEMEEAANMDGASLFSILWRIYIPLSKPMIATLGVFYFVQRWNSWFWESILLRDIHKIPLQVYIRKQLQLLNSLADSVGSDLLFAQGVVSNDTIFYAMLVCSIVPIIIMLPVFAKYFTKSSIGGAVKG